MTLAKLPANACNVTCGLHVKWPHTQFTCVTCSLPAETGKFTRVYAASRIHANCLQPHVNLPEYSLYFTGFFNCEKSFKFARNWHAKLSAFTGKSTCNLHTKKPQLQARIPANAGKYTRNCRKKYPHLQAICYHTAGKFTCKLQVN